MTTLMATADSLSITLSNDRLFPIANRPASIVVVNGQLSYRAKPPLNEADTQSVYTLFKSLPNGYKKYVVARNAIEYALNPKPIPDSVLQSIVSGYWDNGVWSGTGYWDNGVMVYTASNPELGSATTQLNTWANVRLVELQNFVDGVDAGTCQQFMGPDNAKWQQAVKDFNASGWADNLIYQSVMEKMQGYFQQGQALQGNLVATMPWQWFNQKIQDNKASAGQAFVAAVIFSLVSFGAFSAMSAASAAGGTASLGGTTATTTTTTATTTEVLTNASVNLADSGAISSATQATIDANTVAGTVTNMSTAATTADSLAFNAANTGVSFLNVVQPVIDLAKPILATAATVSVNSLVNSTLHPSGLTQTTPAVVAKPAAVVTPAPTDTFPLVAAAGLLLSLFWG
jgi:hypothetical protein